MTVTSLPAGTPERPAVSDATARLYDGLPEVYRDADPATGYALLRYLSLLGDQLGDVTSLLDRLTAGELVDPARADPRWLEWLAQLVGVRLTGATTSEARELIGSAATGWRAGTRGAVIAAVRRAISAGDRLVDVLPHHQGDPHVIAVLTRVGEQADRNVVRATAEAALPAGITVAHVYLADTAEALTWAEHTAVTSHHCPLPSGSLYPSDSLIPC